MAFQRAVHNAASAHAPFDLAEIIHRNGNALRIAGEPEIRIDVVAYPHGEFIHDPARTAFRLDRQRALQYLDELLDLLAAVFTQHVQSNLDRQVPLVHIETSLLQKARKMHCGGIRAVRLEKRRSEQQESVSGHRDTLIRKVPPHGRTSDSPRQSPARPPPSPLHP